MGNIYKITNTLNGKIYIGQTQFTTEIRWKEHARNFTVLRDTMPIHLAMYKYGPKHFIVETVEECDNNHLDEREQFWIAHYNTYNDGYNATIGGDGAIKFDTTQIREQWDNGSSVQEIAMLFKCERHTVAKHLKSTGITEQELKGRGAGRKVCQYTLKGEFVSEYDSISAAARDFNVESIGNIRNACVGIHPSAYNFLWCYADETDRIPDKVARYTKTGKGALKRVGQYDLDGNLINTYGSCREAARSINAPYHVGINSCCLHRQKTAYGYKWEYID